MLEYADRLYCAGRGDDSVSRPSIRGGSSNHREGALVAMTGREAEPLQHIDRQELIFDTDVGNVRSRSLDG